MATLEEDVARNRATRDRLQEIPEAKRTEDDWRNLAFYRDVVSRGEALLIEARERGERPGFQQELEKLCNRYSVENQSDTPDFILAQYIVGCLEAWAINVKRRDEWYSFEPWDRRPLEAPK